MRFVKMHGIGNDYICVDGFSQRVDDPAGLARRVSDRHFGVGGDGLILVLTSRQADARMRMFNADGSEAEMCGNGIRCVAKFAYDRGLARVNPMRVETGAGVKTVQLEMGSDGKVAVATVNMGEPILEADIIPVKLPGLARVLDAPLLIGKHEFRMSCVSMGNPHAVIYVNAAAAVPLAGLGPMIERHELFPQRTNVHFVQVISPAEVRMRTWERGSGITLACGTGASAVCVAGVLTGRGGRNVLAHLPGGDLRLEWRESDNCVYLTGPTVEVFTGDWPE